VTVPAAARGAVALALMWGAVALFGIVLVVSVGPFFGALGCPGSCPDDPVLMRVLRLALAIAAAFGVLAAVVLGLMAAARRTRLAGPAMGVVGAALLVPTGLAVAEVVRGEAGAPWPAVPFLGVGVPGGALLYAAWTIWRPHPEGP
jgi:predicted outer membrane lipoprotein